MSDRVIFVLIETILAVVLLALICGEVWKWRRWSKASAVVLRYVARQRSRSPEFRSYAPVVRFQTPDGTQIIAISAQGVRRRRWERGDTIAIRFNPAQPQCCELASAAGIWVPIASCLALLLWFGLFLKFWPTR